MNSIIKTLHFVPEVSAEHSLSQRNFLLTYCIFLQTTGGILLSPRGLV